MLVFNAGRSALFTPTLFLALSLSLYLSISRSFTLFVLIPVSIVRPFRAYITFSLLFSNKPSTNQPFNATTLALNGRSLVETAYKLHHHNPPKRSIVHRD
uniref:Uncharacterized protein n=1 Tax=Anopheles darlingi TaxID=43151 RepID=A0A2M4DC99_ANODA